MKSRLIQTILMNCRSNKYKHNLFITENRSLAVTPNTSIPSSDLWTFSVQARNLRKESGIVQYSHNSKSACHHDPTHKFQQCQRRLSTAVQEAQPGIIENSEESENKTPDEPSRTLSTTVSPKGPERDPTKKVSYETSIRYLKSEAYKETYGDNRVWVLYRRNFSGQYAPKKTRLSCFFNHKLNTGNPCPICRDEYLVLDYRNVELLKQFISPHNGQILGYDKTGICQTNQFILLAEIEKARDFGTITFDVPFRTYDYSEFYSKEILDKLKEENLK